MSANSNLNLEGTVDQSAWLTAENLVSLKGSNQLRLTKGCKLESLLPTDCREPDWKLCLDAIPDLEKLARTPQDPFYHAEGDVWTHTQMVVRAMLESNTWQSANASDRRVLFFACLLHDIAKPATTVVETDGARLKIGQPGHSARGAIDARILLWRAGLAFAEREAVCRLISVHQLPFFALKSNRAGHTPEFLVRKLSNELSISHLAALAEADMRGRHYIDQASVLDDIELFRELARGENCFDQAYAFADPFTRQRYCAGEAIDPQSSYFREPGSEVIVLSGLPASGKDRWVQDNAKNLPIISFDDARAELGLKHGDNDGLAAHHAKDKAKALLRESAPFVWNATHLSRSMRSKTLDLLHAYHARTTVVYLEQSETTLLSRNHKRDSTLSNSALTQLLYRWDVVLPTEAHEVRYELDK
jgi:predicted kinase